MTLEKDFFVQHENEFEGVYNLLHQAIWAYRKGFAGSITNNSEQLEKDYLLRKENEKNPLKRKSKLSFATTEFYLEMKNKKQIIRNEMK